MSKLMFSDAAALGTSTFRPFKGLPEEVTPTEPPDWPMEPVVAEVKAEVVRTLGMMSWFTLSSVPFLGRMKTAITPAIISIATTATTETMSSFLLFLGLGGIYC